MERVNEREQLTESKIQFTMCVNEKKRRERKKKKDREGKPDEIWEGEE